MCRCCYGLCVCLWIMSVDAGSYELCIDAQVCVGV